MFKNNYIKNKNSKNSNNKNKINSNSDYEIQEIQEIPEIEYIDDEDDEEENNNQEFEVIELEELEEDEIVSDNLAYARVFVLAAAAFIFNTTEFIPVALLSDIAASFHQPISKMGLMMTVYAWVVSAMSLPFMLLTAKIERRNLLIYLFIIFVVGHVLSSISKSFEWLLATRIIIALTHAVFWSITAALVMRVAPKDKQQKALAWLSLGSALAMVLGLPLGRMIGQLLGWRMTFDLIGIISFIIMIFMIKILPVLPSKDSGSLQSVPILFKRPLLVGIYAMTAVVVSAHFTAYSYIEPFVLQISKMSPNTATSILLCFGVSGMLGSWLFGRFHAHYPNQFIILSLIGLIASLLLLAPLSSYIYLMFILILAWGTAVSCLSLCLLVRVLQYAPDATDVATSMYSGIFNIGIGGGALLGGLIMKNPTFGLMSIGWFGSMLAIFGMMIYLFTQWQFHYTLWDIPRKSKKIKY